MAKDKNPHPDSPRDAFLEDEGPLDEATATTGRRFLAWKIQRVNEGLRAAARGDLVCHSELFEKLRRRYPAPRDRDEPI